MLVSALNATSMFLRDAFALHAHPNATFKRRFERARHVFFVSLRPSNDDLDRLDQRTGRQAEKVLFDALQHALRQEDMCIRVERSLYAVAPAAGKSGAFDTRAFSRRLAKRLFGPQKLFSSQFLPRLNIGWAEGGPRPDFEAAMRDARVMLEKVRKRGDGFAAGLCADGSVMEFDLCDAAGPSHYSVRRAVDCGRIVAHFQPIVELETGQVASVEALSRLIADGGEAVGPDVFIPIAEQTGQLSELTRSMMYQAAAACVVWRAAGYARANADLRVAVNISPRQLEETDLVADVLTACDQAGADPSCLTIELTESERVRDFAKANALFQKLRRHGVRIALDDFGTDYAWLESLRDLSAVDLVKLDKTCLRGLLDDERSQRMVRGLVRMIQDVGAGIVVEGVASAKQARRLRDLGVEYVQGQLYRMPAPAEEMSEWLRHGPNPTLRPLEPLA